ncbi:MAG TPA: MGMT family protein [Deltaproteobacteria bacterium]|nr:MGMT family protein [Deltaproteobacteria bacterium]
MMKKLLHTKSAPGRTLFRRRMATFMGPLEVVWAGEDRAAWSVVAITLPGAPPVALSAVPGKLLDFTGDPPGPVQKLEEDLRRYFEGERVDFALDRVPISRCRPFQRRELMETFRIPRGTTLAYGKLAERVGVPGAARAVGTALARNPFPLVIPCHRVIRSSGDVGRFGGGSDMKRALLRLEGVSFDAKGRVRPITRSAGL